MPVFHLHHGRDRLRSIPVSGKDRIVIGRGQTAHVVLDNPAVSREHAEVRRVGQGWMLQDLSGGNGVFVNGKMVNSTRLRDQDRIDILKYTLLFDLSQDGARPPLPGMGKEQDDDSLPPLPAPSPPRQPLGNKAATFVVAAEELARMRQQLSSQQGAHLVLAHSGAPARISLQGRPTLVLGRGGEAPIQGPWWAPWWVPRRVAEIQSTAAGSTLRVVTWWVGVRVNGERVRRGKPRLLADQDVIHISGTKWTFQGAMGGGGNVR